MEQKAYHVGQVLYVIPSKAAKVVPICILEKRITESIKGTQVEFIFQSPNISKPPASLSKISGKIYDSLEDVRKELISNATGAINDLIKNAGQTAKNVFKKEVKIADLDEDDSLTSDWHHDDVLQESAQSKNNNAGQHIEVRDVNGQMKNVILTT